MTLAYGGAAVREIARRCSGRSSPCMIASAHGDRVLVKANQKVCRAKGLRCGFPVTVRLFRPWLHAGMQFFQDPRRPCAEKHAGIADIAQRDLHAAVSVPARGQRAIERQLTLESSLWRRARR
eukprot:4386971-Pleurochrysis_carterae.AAC.1